MTATTQGRSTKWSMGILLLAMAATAGCSHRVRVESPPPVQAARTPDLTEQAILDALPRRGWTVEEMRPGEITAFLAVRKHWLRVSVRYDNAKIVIFYLDSDNLGYVEKDGQGYIHGAWVKWTRNLSRDITRAVAERQKAAVEAGAVAAASGGQQADPAPVPAQSTAAPQ